MGWPVNLNTCTGLNKGQSDLCKYLNPRSHVTFCDRGITIVQKGNERTNVLTHCKSRASKSSTGMEL
jgi:hypothetical protein